MAVIPYSPHNTLPSVQQALADLNEHTRQTRALLTALGDYWVNYYQDTPSLASAMSGYATALSREYTDLLDTVLSSNILDIPMCSSEQFRLVGIAESDLAWDNTNQAWFLPLPEIVKTEFLCSSLFEADVVLLEGEHYRVESGVGIWFYVDLFHDEGICKYVYQVVESGSVKLLFWASDIALKSTVIYERYGVYLYRKAIDSEQYKWFTTALMRFYTNAKTTENLRMVIDVLYGIPYTRYADEVVTDIYYTDAALRRVVDISEAPYIAVETDHTTYYTYAFTDLSIKVGDTLPQFTMVGTFSEVHDYVTYPKWWEKYGFPSELLASGTLSRAEENALMENVLKHNVLFVRLNVSFETYATYLAQAAELRRIIKDGIPVYLYAMIQAIFRAVFTEYVDFHDAAFAMDAELTQSTIYAYGGRIYNGEHTYYSSPHATHGGHAKLEPRFFDGAWRYSGEPTHSQAVMNAPLFDGSTPYDDCCQLRHNADRDKLTISDVRIQAAETWDWESSALHALSGVRYSGVYHHDGENRYDVVYLPGENDVLGMRLTLPLAETVPSSDNFTFFAVRR